MTGHDPRAAGARRMRHLAAMRCHLPVLLALAACSTTTAENKPVACGTETCRPDQLCATITSGLSCDGGGEVVLRQYCLDRPTTCDDSVSCDCVAGCSLATGEGRPCLNVTEDRYVSCGCY
jgi:hypothetical protein